MLSGVRTSNEDVINININEIQAMKYVVEETLNVWAAFFRSNGIWRNSNNPNGVMMAVFGISLGSTGI